MNAFMMLNTTAFAPIAKASVKTAAMVKVGERRIWRTENRRSCSRMDIVGQCVTKGYLKERQLESQSIMTATLSERSGLRLRRCVEIKSCARFHSWVSANEHAREVRRLVCLDHRAKKDSQPA